MAVPNGNRGRGMCTNPSSWKWWCQQGFIPFHAIMQSPDSPWCMSWLFSPGFIWIVWNAEIIYPGSRKKSFKASTRGRTGNLSNALVLRHTQCRQSVNQHYCDFLNIHPSEVLSNVCRYKILGLFLTYSTANKSGSYSVPQRNSAP